VATVSPTITRAPAYSKPAPENPLKTKALRALDDLPPFSPIMNRLLASLAGEEVSFAQLGDLIEKDTVIAGNLLRVVNSALYSRRSAINSVRRAVSVLGVTRLRNIVLGISVAHMWNRTRLPAAWSMKRFDMHSAAVAILSDLLAQHAPVSYPEGAFVAGLFHDLGRLLIALTLPQENAAIASRFEARQLEQRTAEPEGPIAAANAPTPAGDRLTPAGDRRSLVQCEREILGFSHAELSAEALAVWKLPWPVQAAVASHHGPWPAGPSSGKPAGPSSGKPAGPSSGTPAGPSSGKPAGPSSGKPAGASSGKPAASEPATSRPTTSGPATSGPATSEKDLEIPLGRLVDAANQFVNSTGNSISLDPRVGAADASMLGSLGMDPERLKRLLAEFRDEFMSMMEFFT